MVEFSVKFNLVNEGFLSIFLLVGALFGKGFDGIFFFVLVLYDKVDRGEISFSYLFDRFEKLMESSLIDSWLEEVSPFNQLLLFITEEFQFVSKTLEFEAKRVKGFFFLLGGMFEQELEDKVKVKVNFVGEGFVRLSK